MNYDFCSLVAIPTFQVLHSHIWLVVMVLDSIDIACLRLLLNSSRDQHFCINQTLLKHKKKYIYPLFSVHNFNCESNCLWVMKTKAVLTCNRKQILVPLPLVALCHHLSVIPLVRLAASTLLIIHLCIFP